MANEYAHVTLNQLDIEALADYIQHSRRLVYRDGEDETSASKAQDTDKVADVDAANIAVAIDKGHRDTVNNALNLGGRPAADYVTAEEGDDIFETQKNIKENYGAEICDLKDELYQIRNELAKSGLIDNLGQYEGFTDRFRNTSYVNIQLEIGRGNALYSDKGNEVVVESKDIYDAFDVYDFVCLYNPSNETFDVKQIASKEPESLKFILDSDLRDIVKDSELRLYKSKGIIHEGTYKFATPPSTQTSSEEYHTGLSDDSYNLAKRLNEKKKGFGYNFRIPAVKQGFVTNFEICAKAYGSPGSLMCYIIDERDLDKFLNPAQAENDYRANKEEQDPEKFQFFAKSQPYTLESSLGKRYISFNFLQADGTYPLMTRDTEEGSVRYIAIIEALDVDNANYYDIIFLQHRNAEGELGDLELNNTTYYYERQNDDSLTPALTTDDEINKADMYYHVTTRGVVENEPEGQRQGLYTAHYSYQNIITGFGATKARLMLRAKREGVYNASVDDTDGKVCQNSPIYINNMDNTNGIKTIEDLCLKTETYKRIEERENEGDISMPVKCIIGNNIATVQGFDSETITTSTPVLVQNNDKVYRNAYQVSIKARNINFNTRTGEYTVSNYDHYVMPLTAVFKDLEPSSDDNTDRFIYECEFVDDEDNVKSYNDFEFQIFWENRELSNYADIKRDQMGCIKDLVLSFHKGF